MPGVEVNSHGIPAVETIGTYLYQLLDHAESVKATRALEPALTKSDFDDIYGQVARFFAGFDEPGGKKLRQFAIVETAARDVFSDLIATTSIDSPDFVRVWNLFDILSILSDNMECDAPLLFWLIEELLDSQTIAGCRKVFDYLESRRERITAKYFNSTKLVILRSCNDLLRRLSRADDTPFCGRVFIFLFQVFPLGDKSSVNLRGEYHVENVTTYDEVPAKSSEEDGTEKMDVDDALDAKKSGSGDKKSTIDFSALYPVFWSLQSNFSQPKRLFDPDHFSHFKAGMDASLAAFRQVSNQDDSRKNRQLDESRRGIKRKRDKEDKEDELADTYNPKYLTSRDLFELETSDLTFRRHFLLQALIVIEFLLSLSPKAKGKLATTNVQNKSVTYSEHTLSEEDTAWTARMKHDIIEHIKSSNGDGPYFLRMVDTILARDKNWVRWKIESCPSIELPPLSAEEFLAAEEGAQRAFGLPRRRSTSAMGSFSLDFLDEEDPEEALEELKKPSHSRLAALDTFQGDIADEDFEIEVAERDAKDSAKQQAEERKASKTWRALRIVRQTKLSTFDKIENDNDVEVIFRASNDDGDDDDNIDDSKESAGDAEGVEGDMSVGTAREDASQNKTPQNTQPVILAGPDNETVAALAKLLFERNPGVFGIVGQYTTRPLPQKSEDATESRFSQYHHVESKEFDIILDGDGFIGFGESSGYMYGTRRKQIEEVTATNKIPLVLMNYESVDVAKGNDFAAVYVFVKPSSDEALEAVLKASGAYEDDTSIQNALIAAKMVVEKAGSEQGLFDKTVNLNGDLAETSVQLESYIRGRSDAQVKEVGEDGKEEKVAPDEDGEGGSGVEASATAREMVEATAEKADPALPDSGEDAEMADTSADAAPTDDIS